MHCVQIFRDDKMKEVKIKGNILKALTKLSLNNDKIKELYTWNYDNIEMKCYGCYDGDEAFENKHSLPPGGVSNFLEEDSSEKKLFGDLFIVRLQNNKIINTTILDYGEFYNLIYNYYDESICEDNNTIHYKNEEIEEIENKDYEEVDDNYETDDDSSTIGIKINNNFNINDELDIDTYNY